MRAMLEPRAEGEAFNIGDSRPLTQVEFVEKLAKVANVEPTLVRIPRDIILQAGSQPHGGASYSFGEYLRRAAHHRYMGKVPAPSEH